MPDEPVPQSLYGPRGATRVIANLVNYMKFRITPEIKVCDCEGFLG